MAVINISKLDAAKRQLDSALKLFFFNSDVVVIHALAAASFCVLEDLCSKQGIESITKKCLMDRVKPEKKAYVSQKLRAAQNFFKHADNDSDGILQFNPSQTEFVLLDACILYQSLTQERTALMVIYDLWYFSKNSDIVLDSELKKIYEGVGKEINYQNRGKFFELLPIIEKRLADGVI